MSTKGRALCVGEVDAVGREAIHPCVPAVEAQVRRDGEPVVDAVGGGLHVQLAQHERDRVVARVRHLPAAVEPVGVRVGVAGRREVLLVQRRLQLAAARVCAAWLLGGRRDVGHFGAHLWPPSRWGARRPPTTTRSGRRPARGTRTASSGSSPCCTGWSSRPASATSRCECSARTPTRLAGTDRRGA